MQGVALVRNHPVMLFTGILLGLLSSISFIRQSALIKVTTTMEKSELQKNSREETKFHETLYIGVMTSKILPNTKSVHSTWGQATKNIEYFVTDGQNINHLTHHLPVVNLTSIASDKINPLLFELYSVLLYMYHTCIDKFNWFMIANDHLYVRVPKLIKLLTKLDPTADIYLGSPSRTPQNKDLFFRAHRQQGWFCKYSTGIILSRELLRKLVPHLKQCLKDAKLGGSPDVLLGVCIKRNIRIQCSSSLEVCAGSGRHIIPSSSYCR